MNQKMINNRRVVGNKKDSGPILISALLFLTIFTIAVNNLAVNDVSAATSPTLGAAGSYSVLAGSTVTNTGATHVSGNLGVSPGTSTTGFPPGIVGPPGAIHDNDANAGLAQAADTTAFNDLAQTCDHNYGSQDLTLISPLGPGVYCASSSFSLSGTLTLTGSGVWIFRAGSTLTTSPNSNVVGGDPCDVWWQVGSSATLGTNTVLTGNILAYASITLNTGATLNGGALAQTGAVTLDTNNVNGPTCNVVTTLTTTPITTLTTTPITTLTTTPITNPITTAPYRPLPLPIAVGGEMLGVDRFTVLLPWLLLISALAIIVLGTIVVKKRSEPDST